MKEKPSSQKYAMGGCVSFVCIFLLWILLTWLKIVPPFFLPSPIAVFHSLIELFVKDHFLFDIFISLYRIGIGFGLALLVGVPLGFLVGTMESADILLSPLNAFIRYIPPSAFVPISILWFGIGDVNKWFIIFIGIEPYLLLLTADVIANQIKGEYIEAGQMLKANRWQIYKKIIIPCALPGIWDATRLMWGAVWTYIVLVEIIASTSGMGYVLMQSQRYLHTANVIAVMIVIGLLGLGTDFLFKWGRAKLFPWADES
ncbi:MAG: ABC transporter permease [bacterium]